MMKIRLLFFTCLIFCGLLSAYIFMPSAAPIPLTVATPTLMPERDLHPVTDDYKVIEVSLPAAWTDIRTEPWLDSKNKPIGVTLLAAYHIKDFLDLKGEGVSISVSARPEKGYIQLLDEETKFYKKICDDAYKTTWTLEHPVYRGKYEVLDCDPVSSYAWLSVMSMVNKKDPAAYVVRVIGLDMIPVFGEDFRTIITGFTVKPENLPK
jgi:hypothetical protein